MKINEATFPNLYRAMLMIEVDNGAHLIGTIYPGTEIDLSQFPVPKNRVFELLTVEAGLAELWSMSIEDFSTFVAGEQGDQETIKTKYGCLGPAHTFLNDWFNDWNYDKDD